MSAMIEPIRMHVLEIFVNLATRRVEPGQTLESDEMTVHIIDQERFTMTRHTGKNAGLTERWRFGGKPLTFDQACEGIEAILDKVNT